MLCNNIHNFEFKISGTGVLGHGSGDVHADFSQRSLDVVNII